MKQMRQIFPVLAFMFLFTLHLNAGDLNTKKMESVTKSILDAFVNDVGEKSDVLRKHISKDWLEEHNLNVSKFKINNYSPDSYEILYTGADVCIASIGGDSWAHLVVFKFTVERGTYRVIPRGISEASSDYIDPWWSVKDYICKQKEEKIEEK